MRDEILAKLAEVEAMLLEATLDGEQTCRDGLL